MALLSQCRELLMRLQHLSTTEGSGLRAASISPALKTWAFCTFGCVRGGTGSMEVRLRTVSFHLPQHTDSRTSSSPGLPLQNSPAVHLHAGIDVVNCGKLRAQVQDTAKLNR